MEEVRMRVVLHVAVLARPRRDGGTEEGPPAEEGRRDGGGLKA